jgi:uncharacterized membrane protein YqjE
VNAKIMSDAEQAEQQQDATDSTLARLGDLLDQLKDEVSELVDSRLNLLAEEVKTETAAYARGVAALGLGGAAATIGLTLLHVRSTRRTGAVYLAAGTVATALALWRLRARRPPLARTVAELKKDAQLLSEGLEELTG